MKKLFGVVICFAYLTLNPIRVHAIVGYVNSVYGPGEFHLFANPLDDGVNTLSSALGAAPDGTVVSFWDPATLQFSQTSTRSSGAWSLDHSLYPGQGAMLTTPTLFTNTFAGEVVSLTPPPPYSGPDGIFLLSSVPPISATGEDVFNQVLGRGPAAGERFTWVSSSTFPYTTTTTYLGGGLWDNGTPALGVAEAAFFNIGSVTEPFAYVPEPATYALLGIGSLVLMLRRRR